MQMLAEEAEVPVVVEHGRRRGATPTPTGSSRPCSTCSATPIKFSEPGEVVTVRTERHGAFVEFCVSDQGRGIPEDKLDSIFARFQQVDSSDAREKGGTGLGLAISRSIIEKLGGRIWAANNPDRRRVVPVHPAGARRSGVVRAGDHPGRRRSGPAGAAGADSVTAVVTRTCRTR